MRRSLIKHGFRVRANVNAFVRVSQLLQSGPKQFALMEGRIEIKTIRKGIGSLTNRFIYSIIGPLYSKFLLQARSNLSALRVQRRSRGWNSVSLLYSEAYIGQVE